MPRFIQDQVDQNNRTRGLADSYASHRDRITSLLIEAAGPMKSAAGRSLCVFGAGNCNDFDAGRLAAYYQRIDLVDIDAGALRRSQQKLREAGCQLVTTATTDLTGLQALLDSDIDAQWEPEKLGLASREAPVDFVDQAQDGSYDCVLSACTLSQIMAAVVARAKSKEPQGLVGLITEVRRRHIELMVGRLRPGGRGLLALDFLSCETLPELQQATDETLMSLVGGALAKQNFFVGCHPMAVADQLRAWGGPEPDARLGALAISKPWIWNLGRRRLAVTMLAFARGTAE